jgi:hypothetical protein
MDQQQLQIEPEPAMKSLRTVLEWTIQDEINASHLRHMEKSEGFPVIE